jgi:hypothetical protein
VRVVHAYGEPFRFGAVPSSSGKGPGADMCYAGAGGGGYALSAGVGWRVAQLVDEFINGGSPAGLSAEDGADVETLSGDGAGQGNKVADEDAQTLVEEDALKAKLQAFGLLKKADNNDGHGKGCAAKCAVQ